MLNVEPNLQPYHHKSEFRQWVTKGWPSIQKAAHPSRQLVHATVHAARDLLAAGRRRPATPNEIRELFKALQTALNALRVDAQKYLNTISPVRIKWGSIPVIVQDRMPTAIVKEMLAGIDYVVALFKRRGVEPLLQEALKKVHVRWFDKGEGGIAYYRKRHRLIILTDGVRNVRPDFIEKVALHEVGHLVHLDLMHPTAREAWNNGWRHVEHARSEVIERFHITEEKRATFWDLLVQHKGNLRAVARALTPLDKANLHHWLRHPLTGNPLVTPKQLRWMKDALRFFVKFFQDQSAWAEDRGLWKTDKTYQSDLLKAEDKLAAKMGLGINLDVYPQATAQQIKQFKELDPSVEQAIDALQLPADYARENPREDFAETFVIFMTKPEQLSEVARQRMKEALSLSNLYGKRILRVSYIIDDDAVYAAPV